MRIYGVDLKARYKVEGSKSTRGIQAAPKWTEFGKFYDHVEIHIPSSTTFSPCDADHWIREERDDELKYVELILGRYE